MSNISGLMTASQVAQELGISTRTLRRWADKGYFSPERIPNSNVQLYHIYYVGYLKRILSLDRSINTHLKLLDGLRKRLDENMLEQDYIPGQPLKLLNDEDIKKFGEAYDDMEKWEQEYKRLLDELMKYPRQMLKTTIEDYEGSSK